MAALGLSWACKVETIHAGEAWIRADYSGCTGTVRGALQGSSRRLQPFERLAYVLIPKQHKAHLPASRI
jgi:hypothetical protein